MIDLNNLQKEVSEWADYNFGTRKKKGRLVGATEEFGELAGWMLEEIVPILHAFRQLGKVCHHHEKGESGIRGTPEFHESKKRDALGDIMIYLLDFCELHGWSYEEIINETWAEVSERDWVTDPIGGMIRYEGEETIPKGLKYDRKE